MLSSRQTTLKFGEDLETIYFILTILIGWGVASWLLLGYANKTTTDLRSRSKLVSATHGAVMVLQFALLVFFVFILANRNYEDLTWYANAITSVAATAIMLLFSAKFMHWYVSYHKNILLLFYTLAAASLAVTVATDYGAKQAFLQVVVEPSDVAFNDCASIIVISSKQFVAGALFALGDDASFFWHSNRPRLSLINILTPSPGGFPPAATS